MTFKKPKANVIKASYRLMQKVGMGPVPDTLIEECETFIRSNNIDFLPWALSCMRDLNEALLRSLAGGAAMDDELRASLVAPIMQLKASGAMFGNAPLTMLAATMLHFLENIPHLDQDVLDIIRANEAVLTAFLRDGESGVMTPTKAQLVQELKMACNRYAAKNKLQAFF